MRSRWSAQLLGGIWVPPFASVARIWRLDLQPMSSAGHLTEFDTKVVISSGSVNPPDKADDRLYRWRVAVQALDDRADPADPPGCRKPPATTLRQGRLIMVGVSNG